MKKVRKKIDAFFSAVAFAEAGEYDVAREFLREPSKPLASPAADTASARRVRRIPGRDLRESIGRYAAAAAFGESGEADTAVAISHSARNVSKVLLAVDGLDLDMDALRFAANLCTRMDASLDVLEVVRQIPREMDESLQGVTAKYSEETRKRIQEVTASEIPIHVSVSVGDVDKEVYAYAKNHKEVVAVVFDSPHARNEKPDRGKWTRILRKMSRRLAIPLITAESKEPIGAL